MRLDLVDKVIVKTPSKDGSEKQDRVERSLDSSIIFGRVFKIEKRTSKNGKEFADLVVSYRNNTFYHIIVFDVQQIDILEHDTEKGSIIFAVCERKRQHNDYKNCDEDKFVLIEFMTDRRILLDPTMPEPEKHGQPRKVEKAQDDLFLKEDDDFEVLEKDEELPF